MKKADVIPYLHGMKESLLFISLSQQWGKNLYCMQSTMAEGSYHQHQDRTMKPSPRRMYHPITSLWWKPQQDPHWNPQ